MCREWGKWVMIAALTTRAATAGAQVAPGWPTDCFPGWEHWREQSRMNATIYTAIVERCNALTGMVDAAVSELPTYPTWWRDNRSALVQYKAKLVQLLPYYVPPYTFGTNLLDYFNSPTNYAARTIPAWNVNLICATNRMPTNYFAYTPWRNLDGLGPYTNDTTVGHPHGFTNEWTQTNRAGNLFPAGRTNWYTTDYGWDGMTGLLSRCVWTVHGSPDNYPYYSEPGYSVTNWTGTFDASAGSDMEIEARRATAVSNWAQYDPGFARQLPAQYTYTFPQTVTTGDYNTIQAAVGVAARIIVGPAVPWQSQYYFDSGWYATDSGHLQNTNLYDAHSTSYTNRGSWLTNAVTDARWYSGASDIWGVQCVDSWKLTGDTLTFTEGATNMPLPWCEYPITAGEATATSRGWIRKRIIGWMLRWDHANGFQFW